MATMQSLHLLLIFLFFSLCCVAATTEIQVFGYQGREVKVSCSYDEIYESYEKYLCRNDCDDDQLVLKRTTEPEQGKYSISDDTNSWIFTTTISNLQQSDAGTYLCGITKIGYDEYLSKIQVKVIPDTCCGSSTKVQHYEGGSVSIRCPYESQYQNNLKYICRGNRPSTCLQQAVVTSNNKHNTRFSLTDDKDSTFTVTITSPTRTDSGSYLCGVQRNTGFDVFFAVDLKVKENICCDRSTKLRHYEGGSVSIRCPYEYQYWNKLKYICRGNRPSTCLQQAVVTSNNKHNTRFSLTDDKRSTFTVTITSLTRTDSGSYLCGVERNTDFDVLSAVDLEVEEWCCVESVDLSSPEGHPLTIHCPYPPHHETNRKFLCKGDHHTNCTDMIQSSSVQTDVRFTLKDDVSSGSFLVLISELEAGDAGTYWCGSDSQWSIGNYTKIHLSVDVANGNAVVYTVPVFPLFLLIVVLIIVYKYKCHKVKESGTKVTRSKVTDEEQTYENHKVVITSKQKKSKQQRTCSQFDGASQDSVYENFHTTEEIYCNDFHSEFNKI